MLKDAQIKDAQISVEQDAMTLAEDIINVHIADEIALDKMAEVSAYDPENIKWLEEMLFGKAA